MKQRLHVALPARLLPFEAAIRDAVLARYPVAALEVADGGRAALSVEATGFGENQRRAASVREVVEHVAVEMGRRTGVEKALAPVAAPSADVLASLGAAPSRDALTVGDRVDVYRNLLHGKGPVHRWSVRARRGPRRVLAVLPHVVLVDVEMHVGEAGWARVHASGVRDVHAWAIGTLQAWGWHAPRRPKGLVRITYNAARGPDFHVANPNTPSVVTHASLMWFDPEGAWMKRSQRKR